MASAAPSVTGGFTPGQVVRFERYTALEAGIEPIFTPGQLIRIESVNPIDGALVAVPAEGEGEGDTVFLDEVSSLTPTVAAVADDDYADDDADEVSLSVAAASKVARKSDKAKPKAKAKVAAKAKPAPKAAAPKAKATAKAKAKPAVRMATVVRKSVPAEVQVALPIAEPTPVSMAVVPRISEVMTENGRVLDTDRVAAILSEQDALDAAKALVAQAEETYFTLGGVLSHIYYEGIHKTLGYDGKRGFEAYVEQELGVHYRKAMYLIDIYTKFRKLGIDERRLTQIGWSKAKELTKFVTRENFDELMEVAETKSREELLTHLRETFVDAAGDGGATERTRKIKMQFAFLGEQADIVTRALDAARERVGSDDLNAALECVCSEWLMLSDSIEVPLEDAIRHIEVKYGIRLVPQSAVSETPMAVNA